MISIQDLAALAGIFTFLGGALYWLGSKIFVPRKEFHRVKADIIGLQHDFDKLDYAVYRLKKEVFGENDPPAVKPQKPPDP